MLQPRPTTFSKPPLPNITFGAMKKPVGVGGTLPTGLILSRGCRCSPWRPWESAERWPPGLILAR